MRLIPALCLATSIALTGCAMTPTAAPVAETGAAIQGHVHGGQQAVVGAHVYLFAASTAGYGSASVPLLSATKTGLSDSLGAYVLTDSAGFFSITNDYTCTANTQVYLYAVGGNPGSGTNAAASFLAALGNCPTSGSFASTIPTIWVNEVSTVATAYAIAGFANDATHVASSGTAAAQLGIANAFANVTNLVATATGTALALTPAGNGTVQQTQLNALANILVSCVNSTGPSSTGCNTLFSNTLSGGLTGNKPTDTASAAINIAHNPGVNVAQLYTLATPKTAFAPSLTSAPSDWHLSINYTGGGMSNVFDLAIDGFGNVWVVNYNTASLSEFSPLGAPLSGTTGFVGGGLSQPQQLVVDTSNNIWVSNYSSNSVGYHAISEFSNGGSALSNNGYACNVNSYNYSCDGLTIDSSGDVWSSGDGIELEITPAGVTHAFTLLESATLAADAQGHLWIPGETNSGARILNEWTNTAATVAGSPFTGGGLAFPKAAAVDGNGSIWLADTGNAVAFNNAGVPLSGSPFTISYSGSSFPNSVAVDGANSIWISNGGNWTVVRLNAAGTLYPGMPFNNGVPTNPTGNAIDGSGNVWVAGYGNVVSQLIGAAAPTIVPVALAVKNNTIGTLP